ncbi:hypothetical protein M514_03312 [Trichuris suis]|uniref:Uncharacterized protein n=1 Tax=Trichuris suis TaxID=68888 RepID=A0A085MQK9_9BILA|nr:hypothetical protein M514_03312 [Trichuris suis]
MPETYEVSRSGSIFSPAKDQSKMWIHEEETDSLSGLLSAVAPDVERTFERTMDEGQKSAELPQEEMPSEAVLVSDQYSSRLSPDSLREDDEKTSAAAELSGIPSASAEEVQLSSPAVLHYSLDEVTPMWSSEPVTEPKEGYGREPAAERVPKLPEEHAASEETDADWVMVSMMETAPLPSLEEPILSPRLPESTDDQQERDKERQVSDNVLSLSADSLDGGEPTEESPVSEVAVSVRSAEAALEMTSEEENNSPRRRVLKPRVRSKQGSFDNVSDTASLLEFERLEREINLRGGGDSLSSSETELMVSHAKRRCSNGSQSSLAEFERLERELDESTTTGREERAHGQNGDTVDVMLLSDIKEESETEELSSVSGRQTAASFDQHSLSFGDQDDSMQKLDSGMTTPEYVPQDGYHVERIEDQVEPCMVTSIDSLEGELPMEPQTEASSTRMPTISLVSSDSLEMYRERTDADSSVVPEAACAVGGMKFIGDFALSDRDSLIASSTSEMSADDGQETGVVEKSDLVSSDTMASFQEYGDEGERDSLCGDFKTADDEEALSTPVDETRLPFSVGVVGSSSTRVSSSGGMGAGDDFATTITRFETHRALDDGCMEVITRTVSTRVTDPVSTRIRFTGADSAAQSVTTISARPPTYEEFTSTDEMGNVTRTVVRRISAAEVSGLHDLDGSIGIIPMSETGSLGGSRSQARTSQGDVSVERREYRRSYGEIRSSRNHLSDGDYQPRRPTLLRQGDRRSRRRSNGVERKSPDSDGSSDSLDAFNSNA